jgi:hypothetical protein
VRGAEKRALLTPARHRRREREDIMILSEGGRRNYPKAAELFAAVGLKGVDDDESRYTQLDSQYEHITLKDGKKFFMRVKGEKDMLGGRVLIGTKVDDEGGEISTGANTTTLHVIDVTAIQSRKPTYWHLKYGTLHVARHRRNTRNEEATIAELEAARRRIGELERLSESRKAEAESLRQALSEAYSAIREARLNAAR